MFIKENMSVSQMGKYIKDITGLSKGLLLDGAMLLARKIKTIKVAGDEGVSVPVYSCEKCGHAPQKALLAPGDYWNMDAVIRLPEWKEMVATRKDDLMRGSV
jgi:hypothetical protein